MAKERETWEDLLKIVKDKQQNYYEILADWLEYLPNEEGYCKQNIGFALFCAPTSVTNPDDDKSDKNVTDVSNYKPEEQKLIDKIYNLINKYGRYFSEDGVTIRFGVIYNIILPTKVQMEKSRANCFIHNIPIFKIKNMQDLTVNKWYIDHTGRVYKSWDHYLETNTLPKCTMVVPKDGILQSMSENITEEKSTVWLEVLESPACNTKNKILKGIDIGTSITGLTAGIGLAVTSFVMPVAPIVILGAVGLNVATGAWAFGRSTQKLKDRKEHEESIGLDNMDAATAWLGIAGSTFGVAAGGSGTLLAKAAQQGRNISMAAKVAYNSSMACSLGVNGIGALFQGYNIYANWAENGKLEYVDVVCFTAHVLFFANSVVSVQTAENLIQSSQGKVIDDYRSGLSKARHRNAYNRMVRKIGQNISDPELIDMEIVRRINMKGSTRTPNGTNTIIPSAANTFKFSARQFQLEWDINAIIINGYKIIDPMLFIKFILNKMKSGSEETSEKQGNDSELTSIVNHVLNLIDLNLKPRETRKIPTKSDVDSILYGITDDQDVLKTVENLLKVTFNIVTRADSMTTFFTDILRLLYKYLCTNAWKYFQTLCTRIKNCTLRKAVFTMGEIILGGIDSLVNEMLEAFRYYFKQKEDRNNYN